MTMEKLADNHRLVEVLRSGGTAVLRTDTIYGVVASAANQRAVENVYVVKKRTFTKSCIILIADPAECYGDASALTADIKLFHTTPTSFLISSPDAPKWLLRTSDELAYRVPANQELRELLKLTGPLIAPSANPEGQTPARNIAEAKEYFGELVDIYVDGGEVPTGTKPSQLVRIRPDGGQEWLRR